MGSRRKGREFALQALYLADVTQLDVDKAMRCVIYGGNVEEKISKFAERLSQGTSQNREALDVIIKKYTKNWEISRMAALDRNILRLGAFELIYELDTPVSVIIDEAVEIAKIFSTDESGKFVNGILDKIKNERTNSTPPDQNDKNGIQQEN